jgi:hypothetical protein
MARKYQTAEQSFMGNGKMAGHGDDELTTKPNRSTGIKGLSYHKGKRTFIVYEYRKGDRIEHGSRRNFEEALKLHAKCLHRSAEDCAGMSTPTRLQM